jgi:glyoxylate/hydroxypyruvate reductase A
MDVVICTAVVQDAWREALAERLPEARIHVGADAPASDYAVVWKPPAEFFARQPRLKALFSLGAGVDSLLAMPTLPRGVPLVRMEDAGMAEQMVEYALYVALREFRRMPEYEAAQAAGRWAPRHARQRSGFTVGVLGLGVLGGAVARALAGFGFDVLGWSRAPKALDGVQCAHGADGLDAVLSRSHVLLLFLPRTPDTEGLLDAARLARLPPGAAVVNVARGELVDDAALLDALDRGHVARAYLDVFAHEPLPAAHRYWTHPGVHLTPHVAALTDVAVASAQVAEKIRRFEAGQAVGGVVDLARGY